ncbi:DnaJ family domain-containing protein [Pseudovibrio exalbescens]|uniref:DnaJ family domain-containing protein n=1 Tax=Pseudovibrio exalbescens TaxID=197461 RepID=UPI000C9A25C3|nr:DnaJ family domain-containing protein [Pseudovibrio exalbescens]
MFDRLIERQMRRAQSQGDLKDIAGSGKPLPRRYGLRQVSTTEALSVRAMRNTEGGDIDAAIKDLQAKLQAATDEDERTELRKAISDLQLRKSVENEARRGLMRG